MTRQCQATSDSIDAPLTTFDTMIEWLLAALLVFMPLAFGARNAWTEEVVIILSGAIAICFLLKLIFYRSQGIIWTWAYVPIGVFLLVAAFQLFPLPVGLINIISPNTAAIKTELLGDLPDADSVLKLITLSFYPNATKHDLRLVLAVAAVFVVVLNVFHRPNQIKRLLMVIALIGGVVMLIALVQDLFGNGKIYWFVSTPHGKTYSGPFVNHSHYGQFINLSIGAAFGLLVVKLHENFTGRRITPPIVFDYFSSASSRILWLLVAIMSLGAATVFISLTRAGMVSMLIAAAFTTLLVTSRQSLKGRSWIIVIMALAAFTCVLYIGFDAVYDRLATLRNLDNAYESRWQILKDLSVSFRCFPVLGIGLGTHSVVYPMFSRLNTSSLFTHAENEYAQAAEETGLVGFVSLIIFGVIIWSNYARSISNANLPICSVAYGLGFGLLAVLIHSFSDYGQHIPANAFLSAVFCALLLVLARMGQNKNRATQIITCSRKFKALCTAVFLGVSGIWIWALIGANNFRIAEAHWEKVLVIEKDLVENNWQGTDREYADLIFHAAVASDYQPENIEYRYWLNVYRWHSISRIIDADAGVISEDSMLSVRDIVGEFHKACTLCPTFGATYCMLGQLEKFILGDPRGAEKIRKGFRLAPCDPIASFIAGSLDVVEGRDEDSIEKFKRAVQLDGSLFKDVVDIYINHLSRPHLAISAAGDDIGRLSHVANVLGDMQYNDLMEQTQEKIRDLLEAKCSKPDAPASAFASLADIYRKQQDDKAAIEYYHRALALNYGQVHWRFTLAKLLARMERMPEAVHEARICLRLRPQFKAAEKFIADLSVNPAAFSEEIKSP